LAANSGLGFGGGSVFGFEDSGFGRTGVSADNSVDGVSVDVRVTMGVADCGAATTLVSIFSSDFSVSPPSAVKEPDVNVTITNFVSF
jgi:hypothetical protein